MELKPCPFCGSVYITIREHWYDGYKSDQDYYLLCEHCGVEGPWSENREQVIQHWNTRVKEEQ